MSIPPLKKSRKKRLKRFKYTTEQLAFLRAGYAKMSIQKLLSVFNRKFGLAKTFNQLRYAFNSRGITCGRKGKERLHPGAFLFTPKQIQFLREKFVGRSIAGLTTLYNTHFKTTRTEQQIKSACHRRHFKSGRTGHFEKGHKSWNKGTKGLTHRNVTTFKKGNVPGNIKPLGTERITRDGYIEIKIAETNPYANAQTRYKLKHVWLWEQAYGPVPPGHVVAFKDSNSLNCVIENLMLLSRKVLVRLNKKGYKKVPDELKPSILQLVKLEVKIFSFKSLDKKIFK